MNFNVFRIAVAKQFELMQQHQLFRVQVDKDLIYATYLGSFPEGSNPKFRERSEHDCSCCRQFIQNAGDVVAVIDGKTVSIWDILIPSEPAYQAVANALSALIKSKPIENVFLHYERTIGTDKNFEELVDGVKTWEHFFVNVPAKYVAKNSDIPTALAGPRTTREMMMRALNEITDDSVATVLELIANRSLYRGDEHKASVEGFQQLKKTFNKLKTAEEKEIFGWTAQASGAVAHIRNTVIGTLLTDLSEGKGLDRAVESFEAKVAPANYKRPTALVTKRMIDTAKLKLEELGLTSALDRRYATINDITINNIMFANRDARKAMAGDVFDDLTSQVGAKIKSLDKVEEVPIARFISEILPRAESLEIMFENQHADNLVSLISPSDPTAGGLFKWPNNFSWSYNGEMADSVKERVKKAGGNVTGDLCCRLAWFNHDDLDLHMKEPGDSFGPYEIYFANRASASPSGGRLDVDMNAGSGTTREPVENIFYETRKHMVEGIYSLEVHQYSKRETSNVGFEVELDFLGTVHRFVYDKAVTNRDTIVVVKFEYSRKDGIRIIESLPSKQSVKTVWNIPTQTFHKVNVMMMSPNYWDDRAVGNKHYFFMIDGCLNDGSARGFFNEFLKDELSAHRKVFEMVGDKMKVADSNNQLSGLGFSSTRQNALICRVKGSFSRLIKIVF